MLPRAGHCPHSTSHLPRAQSRARGPPAQGHPMAPPLCSRHGKLAVAGATLSCLGRQRATSPDPKPQPSATHGWLRLLWSCKGRESRGVATKPEHLWPGSLERKMRLAEPSFGKGVSADITGGLDRAPSPVIREGSSANEESPYTGQTEETQAEQAARGRGSRRALRC